MTYQRVVRTMAKSQEPNEEMRELIGATLSLVRARLEEEKKRDTIINGRSA